MESPTTGSTPPETKTCPYCAETIKAAAVVCRYCGRSLERNVPQRSPEPQPAADHSVLAVLALLIGMSGFVAWMLPWVGFPVMVSGIFLGITGRQSSLKNYATIGMILSILGLGATLANSLLGAMSFTNSMPNAYVAPTQQIVIVFPTEKPPSATPRATSTPWPTSTTEPTFNPKALKSCLQWNRISTAGAKIQCVIGRIVKILHDQEFRFSRFVYLGSVKKPFIIKSSEYGFDGGLNSCMYFFGKVEKDAAGLFMTDENITQLGWLDSSYCK